MPTKQILSLAAEKGKTKEEAEKLWDEAKKIVDKNYSDIEKDSNKYYALVIGVFKKMLGLKEGEATITTTSAEITSTNPIFVSGNSKETSSAKLRFKNIYYGN